jgi:hypothetical protein
VPLVRLPLVFKRLSCSDPKTDNPHPETLYPCTLVPCWHWINLCSTLRLQVRHAHPLAESSVCDVVMVPILAAIAYEHLLPCFDQPCGPEEQRWEGVSIWFLCFNRKAAEQCQDTFMVQVTLSVDRHSHGAKENQGHGKFRHRKQLKHLHH